jgi:hypothetical protein
MAEINKYEDMTDFVGRNRYDEQVIKVLVNLHNNIFFYDKVKELAIALACLDTLAKYIEAYIPREEW